MNVTKMENVERGMGNVRENEKWDQSRDVEMTLLIGEGVRLGFVPIFHFPVTHALFPLPASRFRNIPPTGSGSFQDCSEFLVLFKTDMHILSFKYQIS